MENERYLVVCNSSDYGSIFEIFDSEKEAKDYYNKAVKEFKEEIEIMDDCELHDICNDDNEKIFMCRILNQAGIETHFSEL